MDVDRTDPAVRSFRKVWTSSPGLVRCSDHKQPMPMTDAEELVHRLLNAYERGDVDTMTECFTDDAVYIGSRVHDADGKPAIHNLLLSWFNEGKLKVLGIEYHYELSDGTTVMHERTDRCVVGDREIVTTLCSIFDVDKGLIRGWREYFALER